MHIQQNIKYLWFLSETELESVLQCVVTTDLKIVAWSYSVLP